MTIVQNQHDQNNNQQFFLIVNRQVMTEGIFERNKQGIKPIVHPIFVSPKKGGGFSSKPIG